MNPWPIYETAKKHWRKTRTFLSEQEIRWQHPGATDEEIIEGMIEFNLAFEHSFQHETWDFEGDFFKDFGPASQETVQESRKVRSELFRRLADVQRELDKLNR